MEEQDVITILIIDDDAFTLKIVNKILLSDFDHGTTLLTSLSGKKGLDLFMSQKVDLVLLDVNMPEIDGMEVLKTIRRNPANNHVPIIMMSGIMSTELEAEAFKNGATDFIHKPFTSEVITARLERHLRFSYLQQKLNEEVKKQTTLAEQRLLSNERLLNEMVLALAQTIDAKDQYTRGHSIRVAKYARTISKISGDSEQQQLETYYAGLLHDIGKIGIPGDIINKQTKLTQDEYEIIKTHTTIGYEILKLIKEAPQMQVGARYHHERYDGKGYPLGLKGEEIPRMARIIGVADSYDSMTSKRSYRDCLPQSKVREEMEKGIGTQFDPQFCKIMLKMIDMDTDYRMRADIT